MHAASHHSRSPPARRLGPAWAQPPDRPERHALAAWVPLLRGGGGGDASVPAQSHRPPRPWTLQVRVLILGLDNAGDSPC